MAGVLVRVAWPSGMWEAPQVPNLFQMHPILLSCCRAVVLRASRVCLRAFVTSRGAVVRSCRRARREFQVPGQVWNLGF